MSAYPDEKMCWILHYQDHHDKMSYLTALPNKKPTTIAASCGFAYPNSMDRCTDILNVQHDHQNSRLLSEMPLNVKASK